MKGPWVKETLPSLGNPPEHGCGPAWLDHSSLGTRPKAGLPLLKPIWDFQINADSEFSISLKLHDSICVLHDFCSIFLGGDQLLSPRDCWQKQIWTTEMACPHLKGRVLGRWGGFLVSREHQLWSETVYICVPGLLLGALWPSYYWY